MSTVDSLKSSKKNDLENIEQFFRPFQDGLTQEFQGITLKEDLVKNSKKCKSKDLLKAIQNFRYALEKIDSTQRSRDLNIPYLNERNECYGDNIMCMNILESEQQLTEGKLNAIKENKKKDDEYTKTINQLEERIQVFKIPAKRLKDLMSFTQSFKSNFIPFSSLSTLINQYDEMDKTPMIKFGELLDDCFQIDEYLKKNFGLMRQKEGTKLFQYLMNEASKGIPKIQKVKFLSMTHTIRYDPLDKAIPHLGKMIAQLILPKILDNTSNFKADIRIYHS